MKRTKTIASWMLVLAIGLLAGCSSSEENVSTITTIGNQSNTDCELNTRGENTAGRPILKLTRDGENILGELQNYEVCCSYEDLKVTCEEENSFLNINVSNQNTEVCKCNINIYFTIFNANEDSYQLSLNGKHLGAISFLGHNVLEIDLDNDTQVDPDTSTQEELDISTLEHLGCIEEKSGTMHFDGFRKSWSIVCPVPGSYDSVFIYYPIELDESFMSEGLKVVFSGDYYNMPEDSEKSDYKIIVWGHEYYMIKLSNITAQS